MDFAIGDGWAAYDGPYADHLAHAHVAIQLTIARSGMVRVVLDGDRVLTGQVVIVGPRVRHQMVDLGDPLLLLYLETHTALASRLLASIAPAGAAVAPPAVMASLNLRASAMTIVEGLSVGLGSREGRLDPRLEEALLKASKDPAPGAVARAAASVGLSPARLRALAQTQIRVPLSQWLLWQKLQRAGREMARGAGLAEAAVAGGFADQAHLTRITRRMFGVTPSQASGAVRAVGNRFVQ